MTRSSNVYPLRAYVETLLSYGAVTKTTKFATHPWYINAAGHMDAKREQGGNLGLVERRRYIADSRVVEKMGAVVGRPQGTETVPHQQCQRLGTASA